MVFHNNNKKRKGTEKTYTIQSAILYNQSGERLFFPLQRMTKPHHPTTPLVFFLDTLVLTHTETTTRSQFIPYILFENKQNNLQLHDGGCSISMESIYRKRERERRQQVFVTVYICWFLLSFSPQTFSCLR